MKRISQYEDPDTTVNERELRGGVERDAEWAVYMAERVLSDAGATSGGSDDIGSLAPLPQVPPEAIATLAGQMLLALRVDW